MPEGFCQQERRLVQAERDAAEERAAAAAALCAAKTAASAAGQEAARKIGWAKVEVEARRTAVEEENEARRNSWRDGVETERAVLRLQLEEECRAQLATSLVESSASVAASISAERAQREQAECRAAVAEEQCTSLAARVAALEKQNAALRAKLVAGR